RRANTPPPNRPPTRHGAAEARRRNGNGRAAGNPAGGERPASARTRPDRHPDRPPQLNTPGSRMGDRPEREDLDHPAPADHHPVPAAHRTAPGPAGAPVREPRPGPAPPDHPDGSGLPGTPADRDPEEHRGGAAHRG